MGASMRCIDCGLPYGEFGHIETDCHEREEVEPSSCMICGGTNPNADHNHPEEGGVIYIDQETGLPRI